MTRLPRHLATATTCVLALGAAAPALAGAATAHSNPVQAKTPLVSKIESATRGQVGYLYPEHDGGQPYANEFTGRDASAAGKAMYTITHTAADPAQLPYKLEWLVGVNIEINGDSRLIQGTRALEHHHTANARLRFTEALADYRQTNYFIGQADTRLGVRHPTLSTKPGQVSRDKPAPSAAAVTPTIPVTATLSLTETIRMATPVIAEAIPAHLYPYEVYGLLGPEQTACEYYALVVGRMHVSSTQRAAEREWDAGVSAQQQGNRMLFLGLYHREGSNAADDREAGAGLKALRDADTLIARADADLGVRSSGPSARLPHTLVLEN